MNQQLKMNALHIFENHQKCRIWDFFGDIWTTMDMNDFVFIPLKEWFLSLRRYVWAFLRQEN